MRNLRGIIVAGVFGVLTWLVQQLAQRYSLLLDMAYPFASKTVQELLGGWSAGVDFCVWQVILAVFLVAVVVSIGLMACFAGTSSGGWAGCWHRYPSPISCLPACGDSTTITGLSRKA